MNKPVSDKGRKFPMPAESVNFTDGMIVTADDLRTAMTYPVTLMQSVNRAVFGCGVVCGFELNPDPDLCCKTEPCDSCNNGDPRMAYPSFTVEIGRGTALDCSGLPVELCKPELFDLGDEKCGCDTQEGKVCIFIRRLSSTEAPRGDCCGSTGGRVQCSRLQDHVEIRAFPCRIGEMPEHACMHPFEASDCTEGASTGGASGEPWPEHGEVCECLPTCGDSDCCGEGWILLGCLDLCKGGIVADSFSNAYRNRKWIKTIECLCPDLGETLGTTRCDSVENSQTEILGTLATSGYDQEFAMDLGELLDNEARAVTLALAGAKTLPQALELLEKREDALMIAWGVNSKEVPNKYKDLLTTKIEKEGVGP